MMKAMSQQLNLNKNITEHNYFHAVKCRHLRS